VSTDSDHAINNLSLLADPDEDTETRSPTGGLSGKLLLKIAISLVMLVVLFRYTGLEATFRQLATANLWYVPVGVLCYLLGQLISAYRWQFLSAPLGFCMGLSGFYRIYLVGMFFNLFLPGAIGGDMLRMVYLARVAGKKKRDALLTLLAERGVGLVALMILTSLVCLTPSMQGLNLDIPLTVPFVKPPITMAVNLKWILFSMSLFLLAGYLLLWIIPLDHLAKKFSPLRLLLQARVYWANVPMLCKSVSISLLVHGMMIFLHLLIAQALGLHITVLFMAIVYGIVSLASVLPIAFNGFGVREGVYVLLLTRVGVSPESALAFALYWVIISTLTSLFGGVVFLQSRHQLSRFAG
jgi:glycosyltransferase 2 family protein